MVEFTVNRKRFDPYKNFKIYRCWVSECEILSDIDANANAVAIERITLENEGSEQDQSVKEPVEPYFKKS